MNLEADLPPDVLAALRKSGWTGAKRDIAMHVAALEADGHVVSPVAREFLESLVEVSVRREPRGGGVDWFDFRAERAAGAIYPERVRAYEGLVGAPLCPVGEADCGHTTLFVDPAGRVFGGFDGAFHVVGETVAEALTALWRGEGRRDIPCP